MDYKERLAQARTYVALCKVDRDNSKQKFPIGARVDVTKHMPPEMSHFTKGFEGIIHYTYAQKFGGGSEDYKNYSILVLNNEGKPINIIAWYTEDQLTLVDDSDLQLGIALIKAYKQLK